MHNRDAQRTLQSRSHEHHQYTHALVHCDDHDHLVGPLPLDLSIPVSSLSSTTLRLLCLACFERKAPEMRSWTPGNSSMSSSSAAKRFTADAKADLDGSADRRRRASQASAS